MTAEHLTTPDFAEQVQVSRKMWAVIGALLMAVAISVAVGATHLWPNDANSVGRPLGSAWHTGATLVIGAITLVAVIGVAKTRGIGSVAALVSGFGAVVWFAAPSILEGHNPIAVALTTGAVIIAVAIIVSQGIRARSLVAVIGATLALGLVGPASITAVAAAETLGLDDPAPLFLFSSATPTDVHGILLAALVIAALGAIADMSVTQASAVWYQRCLQPSISRRSLFSNAMRMRRAHSASSSSALFLVCIGVGLPMLLQLNSGNASIPTRVEASTLTAEIVRALSGMAALLMCIPIVTAVASAVAGPLPPRIPTGTSELGAYISLDEPPEIAAIDLSEPDSGALPVLIANATPMQEGPGDPLPDLPITIMRRKGVLRRRRSVHVNSLRKMTRRERKFWEED